MMMVMMTLMMMMIVYNSFQGGRSVADPRFLKKGWMTGQNDIGTIRDKISSVMVLFPFLVLSLNVPKEGVTSHPIHPLDLPL